MAYQSVRLARSSHPAPTGKRQLARLSAVTASVTNIDPQGSSEWVIDDPITQLREWGTDRAHELPPPGTAAGFLTIGRAVSCALRLRDSTGNVSRQHAELVRHAASWVIRDAGSKNGLWQDDARRDGFTLAPGVEVGVGTVRLIAESPRLIALQKVLARIIGWGAERRGDVDRALRAVRELSTLRNHLVLCGEGDLVSVAQHLHRVALGGLRPFVLCDPTLPRSPSNALAPGNEPDPRPAVVSAAGGTLCLRATRLPLEIASVVRKLREPGTRVRLVICAQAVDEMTTIVGSPIFMPPLSRRPGDLTRLIREYADDAISTLGAAPTSFTPRDLEFMMARGPKTLAEIAKGTLRLAAIRHFGGVTRAARYFDISHVALSRWMRLPTRGAR